MDAFVFASPSERLRHARILAGFERASDAARRFGWKYSTYASHENGQTAPPSAKLPQYAKAFGVSIEWLLTGKQVEPLVLKKDVSRSNLQASMDVQEKQELDFLPRNKRIIPILSDDMDPTICSGDYVVVNCDDKDVRRAGIFAIVENSSIIVVQVEISRTAVSSSDAIEIICTPRSPKYSKFNVTLGGRNWVMGRVVSRVVKI